MDFNDTFNDYQKRTRQTVIYPNINTHDAMTYLGLGLTSEAGEVASVIKKYLRDDTQIGVMGLKNYDKLRQAIAAELGDTLWYLARLADELDIDLSYVAEQNLIKLADRQDRDALKGSGDHR